MNQPKSPPPGKIVSQIFKCLNTTLEKAGLLKRRELAESSPENAEVHRQQRLRQEAERKAEAVLQESLRREAALKVEIAHQEALRAEAEEKAEAVLQESLRREEALQAEIVRLAALKTEAEQKAEAVLQEGLKLKEELKAKRACQEEPAEEAESKAEAASEQTASGPFIRDVEGIYRAINQIVGRIVRNQDYLDEIGEAIRTGHDDIAIALIRKYNPSPDQARVFVAQALDKRDGELISEQAGHLADKYGLCRNRIREQIVRRDYEDVAKAIQRDISLVPEVNSGTSASPACKAPSNDAEPQSGANPDAPKTARVSLIATYTKSQPCEPPSQINRSRASKKEATANKSPMQQQIEAARRNSFEDRQKAKDNESSMRKGVAGERKYEEQEREREFRRLVDEMKPLGFTQSSDVSDYIVKNNLGRKFRYISGVLEMEDWRGRWDYRGAFSPDIYARLCEELGLNSRKSNAIPVKFTPYKDLF